MSQSQNNSFSVRVSGDELVFSVAHFITYGGGTCEPLHGHDFHVAVAVAGALDEDHCVIDFIELRGCVRTILDELDHRILLPTQHPLISIEVHTDKRQVNVSYIDRHWSFPERDCHLLPLANTTAELLAEYIGQQLLERFPRISSESVTAMTVEVRESRGHLATAYLINR